MYEAELRDRAGASNRDRCRALDCAGGVIDCLVRHVAVTRVGSVVAAAAPCEAEPPSNSL